MVLLLETTICVFYPNDSESTKDVLLFGLMEAKSIRLYGSYFSSLNEYLIVFQGSK